MVADNTEIAKEGYQDLLDYIRTPGSGLKSMHLPFDGGLLLAVQI